MNTHLEMLERLVLRNPFIPHKPFKQQMYFLADFRAEVLYGGAAGGGKSDALLAAALMYAEVPHYRAVLIRRSYADLVMPGALIDRARAWLRGTGAVWNETRKEFTFPSGAILKFSYLEKPADLDHFQGPEFHFVGFDEVTQFTEQQYTYINSRLRRASDDPLPLRHRSTTNPGGMGHEWVRDRFFRRDEQTGRWVARVGDPERRFIAASWRDNPHIDQVDYEKKLDKLDPVTRARLKNGSWEDIGAGVLFSRDRFVIVEAMSDLARRNMLRFWDLAAGETPTSSRTASILMGYDPWGVFWIADGIATRRSPGEVRKLVRSTALIDGPKTRIRMQQDPGQAGVDQIESYRRQVLPEFDFSGLTLTGSKWARATPIAAEIDQGNVRLVRGPWMYDFFNELELFEEKQAKNARNDFVDALSGAYHCFIREHHRHVPFAWASPESAEPAQWRQEFEDDARMRASDLRGNLYG